MKKNEDSTRLRGKLMLTGTLAMFAMGTLQSEAATTADKDKEGNKAKPSTDTVPTDEQARPSQQVHKFDIPAGTLGQVAASLETALGIKVSVPEKYTSMPSPGVHGVLTAQEALTAALQGTNMSADFVSADRVQIALHATGQDVTVTASAEMMSLKYTAPLRDLPQTLTVIPETIISNTASTTLVEALRTVPGIAFGAGEGGNPIGDRPYIRGVDAQSSTFVDGMRDIGAQSREVFDVESVEVSKGPSGTFAGRSAGGGSINLNSKMARRENFLNGTFSPGTSNFFRGTIDGNAKLTSWASGRLAGMWTDADVAGRDFVHNGRYGLAPSLSFSATKRLHFDTNYYWIKSHDRPDPGIPYNNPTFFARIDGRAQVYQTGDGQPLLVNRKAFYGFNSRDFSDSNVNTAFGRAEYKLTETSVIRNSYRYGKSNQNYVYSMADDSQGNIYYGLVYRRAQQRLAWVDTNINQTDIAGSGKIGSIQHTYAVGAEFSRERSWNSTYSVGALDPTQAITATTGPDIPVVPTFNVKNSVTGATVALSETRCAVLGAAGGNYCTDLLNPTGDDAWAGVTSRKDGGTSGAVMTNSILRNNIPSRQVIGTRSVYGFDSARLGKFQLTGGIRYDHYNTTYRTPILGMRSITVAPTITPALFDLVNYQAAVAYKPTQKATIYGTVSSSATPPGNSLGQGQDPSGLNTAGNNTLPPEKTRMEEVGVKYELFGGKALATGAWFQSDTQNVRITLADSTIAAVGTRRNRGADFGITGYLNRKWQVFAGYTFMNAILTNAGGAGVAAGLQNGRRYPNTPENSYSISSYYSLTRKLNVGGGLYGAGKIFGADNPTTIYSTKWVPGYTRVDLFAAYRFNSHIELQGNLLNVGDKAYFLQAYTTHFALLAPGRTGRVAFNVHW
ncbi:TonB-dependent receptor [Terriglobus roseus]|uniref:Catecholate siderophore receptor n=1 Tax=Terriglobus roseus TaxID=392734 RepID=A0A1G7LE58_9BACT|nr:TonB-dependent receptor [Terriglobus roseus]SDF47807.1 catecholate siderophore receptor [Terriglobus roseus]